MEYRNTIRLPKTKFKMKANLAQREPEWLKQWEESRLYERIIEANAGNGKFVLHDGPPYANGKIHSGTVLNKILKDFVIKFKNMSGLRADYVPGWDCHGLPIELATLKQFGDKKDFTKTELRAQCRKYAHKFINLQREQFRRLGVLGTWEDPYLTLTPGYEAAIVRAFGDLVDTGNLYKGRKPVYWDCALSTALAEAEIAYNDHHRSPSVYVAFPMKEPLDDRVPELKGYNTHVVIWTTTPWTLPANLAISLHPDYEYVAITFDDSKNAYIVADYLRPAVAEACGWNETKVLARFSSKMLEDRPARHPWIDRDSVILFGGHVTLDAGTGCVHTAPGHGAEDYIIGLQNGLDIYSPVNSEGRFDDDVMHWAGEFVFDANPKIVQFMHEQGYLLNPPDQFVEHSYPYGERSETPVIFRATDQWFLSIDKNGLRQRALEEISKVRWIPSYGEERIRAMMSDRPDWCLSRQRSWGVPIPVFYCKQCGETLLDKKLISHFADLVEKETTDIWYGRETADLLPEGTTCPKCGTTEFTKDSNILDVWFDSGVSWSAVCENDERLGVPVDLYLEGSDQHRGWFNSSLVTSVATRDQAPYRQVLTHGFVVDGQGNKMSKRLGNFIPPEDIIKQHGAEILRLWVAAEDYRMDIRLSDEILARLSEAYRKIRNTARFMLGNLADFDPDTQRVPFEEMPLLEQWVMAKLSDLVERCRNAYDNYDFHVVYHRSLDFCTTALSQFYLDIRKDTLYIEQADGLPRRACQTVMFDTLTALIRLLAPITAFTSEEVWGFLPDFEGKTESVHLAEFPKVEAAWKNDELTERFAKLIQVRDVVLRDLETMRREKVIGSSLAAKVLLSANGAWKDALEAEKGWLDKLFITSEVQLVDDLPEIPASEDIPGLKVQVLKAEGQKCERCWTFSTQIGEDSDFPDLCPRCAGVLHAEGVEPE